MLKNVMNMSTFNWLILLGVKILQCTSELISGGTFQTNKKHSGHKLQILSNMGAKMCVCQCHRYKGCNAVNYFPDRLKCQLLAVTDGVGRLTTNSKYMFASMTDWKMSTDSCWPNKSCKEDTRCLPTNSNSHVCSTFVTTCTARPCIHGYCNITNAGYRCTCDAGYSGVNCN